MIGAICTNDILFHPFVTIRAFGWRVFFRAVFEHQGNNFLALLQRDGFFEATTSKEQPYCICPVAAYNNSGRRVAAHVVATLQRTCRMTR